MKISILCFSAMPFFSIMFPLVNCLAQKAELVLKNGTVYTVDDAMSKAQAVAIADGKILAVGANTEIDQWVGANTQVLDLEGKTVVPGFIDSHYHFMGVGRRAFVLNLDGTKSMTEFLTKIREKVEKVPEGVWVRGRGWIEEDWPEKRFPNRFDIDKVAPKHPVFLKRSDGHGAVVNTVALQIAKITRDTPDPEGGKIVRDKKTGNPTGLLLEDSAQDLVEDLIPTDTSRTMLQKYSMKANEIALSYGLTTVHNMGLPWKNTFWKVFDVWKDMYKNDELQVRINTYVEWPFDNIDRLFDEGPKIGLFDGRLTVRGIKITQDGALGSRGAALLEPYSDADTRGLLIYKEEQIYPTIKKALANDIQIAIHAIGDRANRNVLDLYERAFNEMPEEKRSHMPPRFRVEHAQIVHLDDIPRFKKLGIIPSMQPSHAIGDLHFAVRRLGLERMAEGYAWRKFIDRGSYIPAGSDAPVEEGNPMIEFYAAVVRKDTTGYSAEGWYPEYRMTREEALKSLTIWGARAAFEEDMKGSIEPGKLADLVVLDRNLMTEPEGRLFDIKVLMTIVGGEIVYETKRKFTVKK